MVKPWPIEIDGLPSYKMGGFAMAMLNNQMVTFLMLNVNPGFINHDT
jgi:hypothetical protein